MIRTRVGYAGGTKESPTYRDLGDHTETVEIDFDPRVVSYEELLRVFWESHDPSSEAGSRQYMNAVFTHSEAQRKTAEASRAKLDGDVRTPILPATKFTNAEDYHQKYGLRGEGELYEAIRALVGDEAAFRDSTVAARANARLSGYDAPVDDLDIPDALKERLRAVEATTPAGCPK